MRKALIVGIDYYERASALYGCVSDAHAVKAALERDADGTLNFPAPKLLVGTGPAAAVTRAELKDAVRELYRDDAEVALFYFAGHGYVEDTGGYLCGSDTTDGDDGLALSEVMTLANKSPARNKVLMLDSCHSGAAASNPNLAQSAELTEGITILAASTADQVAMETSSGAGVGSEPNAGGGGVFTNLLIDALNGAAANLVGDITPGSVYAHIDQSLGPWMQRPVFKTNVKSFVSLRKAEPPIKAADLRSITTFFPSPYYQLALDPSFEPERSPDQLTDPTFPPPNPANTATFAILQAYARVNLARPVGAPHMWHAAMQSTACELTVLGQHYWSLVKKGLI